jgi:CheY-like chemotaxis protein
VGDPILCGLLAEVLFSDGHAVLTAATADEALAIASTYLRQLSLVIVDVLLPFMGGVELDGVELAGELASANPSLPVLFISGVLTGRELPPGPVLRKPFGRSTFLDAVSRLLPSAQHR